MNKEQLFGKNIKTIQTSFGRIVATISVGALCLTAMSTKINAFGSADVKHLDVRAEKSEREAVLLKDATVMGLSGRLRSFLATGEGISPDIIKTSVAWVDSSSSPKFFDFHYINMVPHSEKRDGRIGNYRIGNWPVGNSLNKVSSAYAPPTGFIEVTPSNQNTPLSEAFTIKDFLTKGQGAVWPKYVYVNLTLVDKLELILSHLEGKGINTSGITVMSGFRTPDYNAKGGDPRGRASLSRHMYGDAADIYIDSDGNGRMDDLNKDGRVDIRDAQVIAEAANKIELQYPSLIGGIGIYKANSSHGPFVHIDTRGTRARW